MSTNTNQRWAEIESLIAEHKNTLTDSTHVGLKAFAEEQGLMAKAHFPQFKHCLKNRLAEKPGFQRWQDTDLAALVKEVD